MRKIRPSLLGYTMIELLIVISIIIILAGLLLTAVFSGGDDARAQLAKMDMNKLASILNGILSEDKTIYTKIDESKEFGDDQIRDKWHCVYIRIPSIATDTPPRSSLYYLFKEKGFLNESQLVEWDDYRKDEYEEMDIAGKSLTEWDELNEDMECKVLADPWGQPYLFYIDSDEKTLTIRSFGPDGKDFLMLWPREDESPNDPLSIRFDLLDKHKLPTKSEVLLYDIKHAEENDYVELMGDYDDVEVTVFL